MQGILFDLDGVLYEGGEAIPGAADAIRWVAEQEIPHLFVTNTTSKPRNAIVAKLAALGMDVREASILTPAVAASEWLRARELAPIALLVPDSTRTDFSDLETCDVDATTAAQAPAALVVGDLGEGWTYGKLNLALRTLVSNPKCQLLALGMTRYWQAEDGLRLDTGAFVTALHFATGRTPIVLGKPAPDFFDAALKLLGTPAAETCMIGDDINSDVGGAQAAGLQGVQVRTGKFRPPDLCGDIAPDAVLDSVADLPAWWERRQFKEV